MRLTKNSLFFFYFNEKRRRRKNWIFKDTLPTRGNACRTIIQPASGPKGGNYAYPLAVNLN